MAQHVARGIRVLADPLSVLGPFPRDGLRTSSFRLFRFIRPKTPLWSPRAREKGREREREERVSAFYRQNALWNWIARPSREGSSSRRPFHHAAAPLLAVLRFFTFPCLFFADDMPFSLLLFRSCLRPLFGVLAFSPELAVSFGQTAESGWWSLFGTNGLRRLRRRWVFFGEGVELTRLFVYPLRERFNCAPKAAGINEV